VRLPGAKRSTTGFSSGPVGTSDTVSETFALPPVPAGVSRVAFTASGQTNSNRLGPVSAPQVLTRSRARQLVESFRDRGRDPAGDQGGKAVIRALFGWLGA
jgi:hypothetical protein